jgi:hypothetical protein
VSDNQTITLPQGEFAAYQRAIESAKNQIALLVRERDEARRREQVACATYDGQQQSYRELETLYQASQERALRAEADALALRTAALAYVTSATYEERERLRAELYVLATVDHAGGMLVQELALLRELASDVARWREAGGDPRDLRYILETMDKLETMKAGEG